MNGQDGLIPYGWDDRVAARLAAVESPDGLPARVIAVHRGACTVTTGEADQRARGRVGPAVGDWVSVREKDGQLTLLAVAERWSAVTRRDPEGVTQVLAANVDIVFVTAPADRLSATRVERETVIAWDSGARPIVLLAKSDLAPASLAEDLRGRLVGVDVISTSAVTGDGMDRFRDAVRDRLSVFVGMSGVGKTSLLNALQPGLGLRVKEISRATGKGKHTTTHLEMFPLDIGGGVVDTPGIKVFGLWDVDGGDLASLFAEMRPYVGGCRFRLGCSHLHEPDCAVQAAVEAKEIAASRYESYVRMHRDLRPKGK